MPLATEWKMNLDTNRGVERTTGWEGGGCVMKEIQARDMVSWARIETEEL